MLQQRGNLLSSAQKCLITHQSILQANLEFHLQLGNLDFNTTSNINSDYVKEHNIPVRVLDCEIIYNKRFAKPRCVSVHIIFDARVKNNAFMADNWPGDITVRAWRSFSHNATNWNHRSNDSYRGWE